MIDFLSPISGALQAYSKDLPVGTLGQHITLHTAEDGVPELKSARMAIIGVGESRSVAFDSQKNADLTACRMALYALYPGNWEHKIVDLGDIRPGDRPEDTRFALKQLVADLIKADVVPIILGQTQSLAYAQYRAYDYLDQMVNVVNVDYRFDVGNTELPISNKSYVGKMVVEQPYNLFNYSVIGYQSFFNAPEEISLMEKLFFDAYRLGTITSDLTLAEPVMRNADMVILDTTAIKCAEMSSDNNHNPNGFDGREICTLARYAGISNTVSSFGVYELGANLNESSAMLVAQIVWYFIEGVNFRIAEDFSNDDLFTTYVVPLEDMDLTFKKSSRSERWWVEVPNFLNSGNKSKRHTLLPCTYADYVDACSHKIPDRWLKARIKNEGKL